jgi:hypothetical protein
LIANFVSVKQVVLLKEESRWLLVGLLPLIHMLCSHSKVRNLEGVGFILALGNVCLLLEVEEE